VFLNMTMSHRNAKCVGMAASNTTAEISNNHVMVDLTLSAIQFRLKVSVQSLVIQVVG
jgi:hypothetical protein